MEEERRALVQRQLAARNEIGKQARHQIVGGLILDIGPMAAMGGTGRVRERAQNAASLATIFAAVLPRPLLSNGGAK